MIRCKVCGTPMEFAPKRLERDEVPFSLLALLTALDFPWTSVDRYVCPKGHCITWSLPVIDGGHGHVEVVQALPAN